MLSASRIDIFLKRHLQPKRIICLHQQRQDTEMVQQTALQTFVIHTEYSASKNHFKTRSFHVKIQTCKTCSFLNMQKHLPGILLLSLRSSVAAAGPPIHCLPSWQEDITRLALFPFPASLHNTGLGPPVQRGQHTHEDEHTCVHIPSLAPL